MRPAIVPANGGGARASCSVRASLSSSCLRLNSSRVRSLSAFFSSVESTRARSSVGLNGLTMKSAAPSSMQRTTGSISFSAEMTRTGSSLMRPSRLSASKTPKAVQLRHHDVEQHEVVALRSDRRQSLDAVLGLIDVDKAEPRQAPQKQVAIFRDVVNDENFGVRIVHAVDFRRQRHALAAVCGAVGIKQNPASARKLRPLRPAQGLGARGWHRQRRRIKSGARHAQSAADPQDRRSL